MRLPDAEHLSRPWRIHGIAPDFELEDVWALPTPGGPDDFPRLVRMFGAFDSGSTVVRALFALRWKIGALLGWDRDASGATLRGRLPADLQRRPDVDVGPFEPLYETDDEFAAEIANRTMHGVLHVGWVPDGSGGHRGQMAVLVKRNGRFGAAYMAAIAPFRHRIVYPRMLEGLERAWQG